MRVQLLDDLLPYLFVNTRFAASHQLQLLGDICFGLQRELLAQTVLEQDLDLLFELRLRLVVLLMNLVLEDFSKQIHCCVF